MTISLNGIIARENREEDFISYKSWLIWLNAVRENGCVIFGRKTYQNLITWPKRYLKDLQGIKVIVISANSDYQVGSGFELTSSPQEALEKLEKQGFKNVVLTGGSTLNSSFAKLGLIDEVILNVEPVIEGKGIPLFKPENFELKLELIEMKQSKGKTIQLQYKVVK